MFSFALPEILLHRKRLDWFGLGPQLRHSFGCGRPDPLRRIGWRPWMTSCDNTASSAATKASSSSHAARRRWSCNAALLGSCGGGGF